MSTQLMDFKETMVALKNEVGSHVHPYLAEDKVIADGWQKIQDIYDRKLNATRPEIMVYGIYNAGKSSIINELLGANKAAVADVPKTDAVDYYDWNGYRLADTPGVGAPIEHEKVTEAHLKKADVVIFVMCTTGANEKKENYIRMKEIADSGKKIIIVLNDKNGDLGTPGGEAIFQEIKGKVASNMQQVGIEEVEKKYCIIVVNAKRAKTGREKSNQKLWDKSNFAELTNVIMQELKRTDSFDIMANAVQDIEDILTGMIVKMSEADNSEAARAVSEVLKNLSVRRKEIREFIDDLIDRQADRLGHELPDILWNSPDNPDIVQKQVAKMSELILKEMDNKVKELVSELLGDVEAWQVHLDTLSYKVGNMKTPDVGEAEKMASASDDEFATILENMKKIMQEIVTPKGIDFKNSAQIAEATLAGEAVGQLVGKLATTAIGKTLLGTTIGKTLASFIPVVGPVITAVTILLPFLGNNNEAKRQEEYARQQNEQYRLQEERRKQAREELAQKCMYMAEDLADTFKVDVDASLLKISDQIARPFKEQQKNLQVVGQQYQVDIAVLREIADQYHVLRSRLQTGK